MSALAARQHWDVRLLFGAGAVLMLAIASLQLFVLDGLTELYLGLPLWIWLQLGVLAGLLVLAWWLTGLVLRSRGR